MRVFKTAGSTHSPRVAKIVACDEPAVLPEADAVAAPAPPFVAQLLLTGLIALSAAPLLIHEEWERGINTPAIRPGAQSRAAHTVLKAVVGGAGARRRTSSPRRMYLHLGAGLFVLFFFRTKKSHLHKSGRISVN